MFRYERKDLGFEPLSRNDIVGEIHMESIKTQSKQKTEAEESSSDDDKLFKTPSDNVRKF